MKNSIFILFLLISGLVDGQKHTKLLESGTEKYKMGDYEGAILEFTKANEKSPSKKLVPAFDYRGWAKYALGDLKGAISDFTLAIEYSSYPEWTFEYYYSRGLCLSELKDNKGAILDFTKSIELNSDPKYFMYDLEILTKAYANRGGSKLDLIDNEGAIIDLKKAIELNPNDIDSYYNIGCAFFNLNNLEKACLYWKKSLALGDKEVIDIIKKNCGN